MPEAAGEAEGCTDDHLRAEYDDEPSDYPSARALQSAILSPYRHLLSPPVSSANASEPQESYFDPGVLPPGSYSAPGASPGFPLSDAGRTSFSAGRDDDGAQGRYSRSFGGSQFGMEGEDVVDDEEEERLAEEWGLGEYLSQLGSQGGSVSGRTRRESGMSAGDLPRASFDTSGGRDQVLLETRSLSGIEGKTVASSGEDQPRPSTSKFRILERPQGRPRSQSLGAGTTLELDAFEQFSITDALALSRPSLSSNPRLSVASYSGLQPSDGGRSTSPYPSLAPSPRPASRASLAPSAELDQPPRPLSTSPSVFTSRFDPSIIALARQEIEKDRPNFANKDAGAPPKVVLMPAPLSGRPASPPRRVRTEGPDPEEEAPEVVEGEQLEAPRRPAGALYGRSLLDVMAERKAATHARQKQYVPGQDGRRSMMDWGKTPAAPFLGDGAGEEGAGVEMTGAASGNRTTIFGPDLVYQRDMQRRLALERAEAEEKEEEEREEREVWERERLKVEANRTNKMRRAAGKKLEGAESPERRERGEVIQTTPRARKHSIAPSLSMPAALDSQAEPNNWFPPSPKAPSLSSSASSNYTPIRQVLQPPSPFQSHPFSGRPGLVSRASDQQAFALRTAVMMGTMTPQQAAAEASRLGLGSNGSDNDDRPLGERLSQSLPKVPPQLQLAFLDTEHLTISTEGKAEIGGRGGSSSDDDVPLGLRHPRADDDDVPLGLRHSMLPKPTHDSDDDDVPLAFSSPLLSNPQQQQQAYLQAQFQGQQAQQAMFMQYAQQRQQLAHDQLALGQGLGHHGQPGAIADHDLNLSFAEASFGGSEGGMGRHAGSGRMVERWRRGVS